jgi:AmmeMemoRadiSam system protein A
MEEGKTFTLDNKDKIKLLEIARTTIEEYIKNGKKIAIDKDFINNILETKCGIFVSLHKNKLLRGCIGQLDNKVPLYSLVQQMSISASSQDPRFPIVTADELDQINIEISVLTPLKKIESIDEFILKKHGIYIKKGNLTGTFLPQVAEDKVWTKEEFLGHCAQDKAGIGWDGWRNAELYTYEAIIFQENT